MIVYLRVVSDFVIKSVQGVNKNILLLTWNPRNWHISERFGIDVPACATCLKGSYPVAVDL